MAQGPIEELLAGSEGVIYIVHLKGDVEAAHQQVLAQPWVSGIVTGEHNGEVTWQVSVIDLQVAESQLLKMLVNNGPVVVTEFRRKQYDLEDVFMQVIAGDSHSEGGKHE